MRCAAFARGSSLVLLALAFTGCATSSFHTTPVQPIEPAASIPYHTIQVNVEASTPESIFEETNTISQRLIQRLQEMNIVSQVSQSYETEVGEGELLLHLTVTDIRKVGGGKRFLLGVFAGKAGVTSNVEFFCGNTHRVIGRYDITAQSTSQGGTRDAIVGTVDAVVKILKETYNIAATDGASPQGAGS